MKWKKLVILGLTAVLLSINSANVRADECEDKSIEDKISCYESKIQESQGQQKTLASTIGYLDNKIALILSEIEQTEDELKKLEEEIATLVVKIDRLDINLTDVSKLLVSRVGASYKRIYYKPFYLFLSSGGFNEFFERNKYLQAVQKNDRKILLELQNSKDQHEEQKNLKEDKQKEVEELQQQLSGQKIALGGQKQEKQSLLEITKNNEKRFQQLLTDAQRERQNIYSAFLAIPDGERKPVKKGEVIGVMGNTGYSTGAHLHFSVYHEPFKVSDHENPTNYLRSNNLFHEATACDDTPNDVTRGIGGGSHDWPMSNPRITQCYGHTPWSWMYSTNFHNGLDMVNTSDRLIRATDDGEAIYYRGGQSAGNGVFIFHNDGKMTLYWHLQ
ncbi:murein hydrolase activator EnvC family protein [Patescibacteria group bacterium]